MRYYGNFWSRLTTPLDARMSNALITVALLTQLKLLPILTLSSMLVESAMPLKEKEMIDPISQFPATRQTLFWGIFV